MLTQIKDVQVQYDSKPVPLREACLDQMKCGCESPSTLFSKLDFVLLAVDLLNTFRPICFNLPTAASPPLFSPAFDTYTLVVGSTLIWQNRVEKRYWSPLESSNGKVR